MSSKGAFHFLDTSDLAGQGIRLVLSETCDAQPERQFVPAYKFDICLEDGTPAGRCDLRIGHSANTYIGGNIGYRIYEPYRGHRRAMKACLLMFELARRHGMDHLYITCTPDNAASARTCELAGGTFVETAQVPPDNDLYAQGKFEVRVYRVEL